MASAPRRSPLVCVHGLLATALLATASLVGGCTSVRSTPVVTPDLTTLLALKADWPERERVLQSLRRFECIGRVAVSAAGQGFNAQFTWRQDGATAQMTLRGPFGAGSLAMHAVGDAIQLELADGRKLDGDAARAEFERTIGALLPAAALGYWLLGAAQPEYPAERTLAAPDGGRPSQLSALAQRTWRIDYRQHDGLPRQLTLTGGDARVRLIVDSWNWAP